MKMLIILLTALLVISGTAWAQDTGPDYHKATNTGLTGSKVVLNANFKYSSTPNYYMYAISDVGKFYISGYRYSGGDYGTWSRVFPSGSYVSAITDTTIEWHSNLALPIHNKVDVLVITSQESGGDVDLVVYQ